MSRVAEVITTVCMGYGLNNDAAKILMDELLALRAENTRLRQTMEDAARAIVNDCEGAARDMLDAALKEGE